MRFALTIFTSAFLLFQVQPLIAKYILPWFGGSPAVWTTCMLFFQLLLLTGYAYAHATSTLLTLRKQVVLHAVLLAISLALLPIIPNEAWKPQGEESPALRILLLLAATVGAPYVLLSTTGPLLQRWFSRAYPDRSPYRLYALSNTGSLLALLSYPVFVEPSFKLGEQAWSWSGGYALFAALCGLCAWQMWGVSAAGKGPELARESPFDDPTATTLAAPRRPTMANVLLWLGLATFPSLLLLATTNQMCQEVAVVPFLWVLPLSLYLISFIICFDSPRWYRRGLWGTMLVIWLTLATACLIGGVDVPLLAQVVVYSLALFSCCMTCHGELAKSKPDPQYLTLFFLMLAAGGALGGVLVVVVAPLIFTFYWELHVGLVMCFVLTLIAYFRAPDRRGMRGGWAWAWSLAAVYVVVLAGALIKQALYDRGGGSGSESQVIARARNFYGVMTVSATNTNDDHGAKHSLKHGRIEHGFQYLAPEKELWRTSYYNTDSGVGIAIDHHPRRLAGSPGTLKIGVIGLGTGSLAAYGEKGDAVIFYDINPEVKRLAYEHFTYLEKSKAAPNVSVVLGDARVQMERQLQDGQSQQFDVLAVDAFSSDAIPMHLLTREAFAIYDQHLAPGGILAVHISNRYLNLRPVVKTLAEEAGYTPLFISWSNRLGDPAFSTCDWVLVTKNQEFITSAKVEEALTEWDEEDLVELAWTDDYGSLLQTVRPFDWQNWIPYLLREAEILPPE